MRHLVLSCRRVLCLERSAAVRLRSGAVGQAKANMLAFTQLARVLNAKATGGAYDVPTR